MNYELLNSSIPSKSTRAQENGSHGEFYRVPPISCGDAGTQESTAYFLEKDLHTLFTPALCMCTSSYTLYLHILWRYIEWMKSLHPEKLTPPEPRSVNPVHHDRIYDSEQIYVTK